MLGDISVTNSSAPWGILARAEELGEWGLGWEHEETLSAVHGFKVLAEPGFSVGIERHGGKDVPSILAEFILKL